MAKIIWVLLFGLLTTSCANLTTNTAKGDITDIFGKVYDSVASRSNSSSSWYAIQGSMALALESGTDDINGVGILSMSNYIEPQTCSIGQSCDCTGTMQFSFKVVDTAPPTVPAVEKPYNVFDPVTTPVVTTTTTSVVEKINIYQISIIPKATNLSVNCRPQSPRDLSIVRYSTGEVIIKDISSETAMKPR